MGQRIKNTLSKREESLLKEVVRRSKLPKHLGQRIQIILLSFKGLKNTDIIIKLRTTEPSIAKWRQRWLMNYEKLQVFSQGISGKGVKDNELINEMLFILDDAPRSGAPQVFTDNIQKRILSLACEHPKQYGLPFTNWTHVLLAKEVVKQGIVERISSRHLGRILKKTNWHPTKADIGFIQE